MGQQPDTPVLRSVHLAFMRLHVLYHAVEDPFYGAAMMEELRRHGYEISAGTFYPLLHRMEDNGLLEHTERVVDGKQRKYYAATEAGREALDALRPRLAELTGELLDGDGPTSLPDPPGERA
ncbi:PadR family transcriptional regulator [Longibacter sp.]|uniref:PadR family transcriptional regulator n=1 Tax=Longibacter sp. TaxID=2045415 RepID=UPI003EBC23AE